MSESTKRPEIKFSVKEIEDIGATKYGHNRPDGIKLYEVTFDFMGGHDGFDKVGTQKICMFANIAPTLDVFVRHITKHMESAHRAIDPYCTYISDMYHHDPEDTPSVCVFEFGKLVNIRCLLTKHFFMMYEYILENMRFVFDAFETNIDIDGDNVAVILHPDYPEDAETTENGGRDDEKFGHLRIILYKQKIIV